MTIVGLGLTRFLLDGNRLAVAIKLHHTVALGVLHVVAKHGGARWLTGRLLQGLAQAVAMEDIVAEARGRPSRPDKLLANDEGLRQSVRAGLYSILKADAPLAAIPRIR